MIERAGGINIDKKLIDGAQIRVIEHLNMFLKGYLLEAKTAPKN